jgi:hypothetical protein
MELKNLFDPTVKQEIIDRINRLSSQSEPQWGKMNVAQMLAHLQMPIGSAQGIHKLPRTLFGKIVGRFAKSVFYGNKPFKRNLPTDPSFVMTSTQKDFEKERQALINMIYNFKEDNIVNKTHPFFGKLTSDQWSAGSWKHLDHHLQQFGV